MTASAVYPLHFGHLAWWQQLLVVLIAFGPFLVLGAVVAVVRRKDLATGEQERGAAAEDEQSAGPR